MYGINFRLQARTAPLVAGLALVAGAGLYAPHATSAAPTPEVKCELTKAAAGGKYAACLSGVYAKSIGKSESPSAVKLFKCYSKFVITGLSAEEKAVKGGGVCPTTGDAYDLEAIVDTCVDDVLSTLGGTPGPGGEQAKCQAAKMKEAGKYSACQFKTLSKAIKDGVAADIGKCEDKLTAKWNKLETGVCSTTGDFGTVKSDLDGCYSAYDSAIDGVPDAVVEYEQDFESLNQASGSALSDDGWLYFANVFDPGMNYLYGYGPGGAPNGGAAFSGIDIGQGGAEQGDQQLVIYSDYNNVDHGNGNLVEANVFRERTIVAGDVGNTITFAFEAKRGNINDPAGNTTALAFIKTLDPNNGYATTNFITVDTTSLPTTWGGLSITLDVDGGLVGQLFQFGFATTATNYEPSGNFYDNIVVSSLPTP